MPTATQLATEKKAEAIKADKKKERARLKAKGFFRNPKIGYTFPGVDIDKVNAMQKLAKLNA